MKSLALFLYLFLILQTTQAQFFENNALYLSGDLTTGNLTGIDINLNFTHKEKYSLQVGRSAVVRESRSTPDDYYGGIMVLFSLGTTLPYDQLINYQLKAGRLLYLNHSRKIRLNLMAGAAYTEIKEPSNWTKAPRFSWGFGSTYSFDYTYRPKVSLVLNPRIEFLFAKVYGLGISPIYIVNDERHFIGLGISQMLGKVRN